jgi:hypothetical protein
LISDQIVLLNCIFEYKNHSSISSMAGYPQLIEYQIQRVGIRYIYMLGLGLACRPNLRLKGEWIRVPFLHQ